MPGVHRQRWPNLTRAADGTERRICARLGVMRGCRSAKNGFRPYAYRQGAMRRQALAVAFCAQAEKQVPTVGDRVYVGACGSEGTIVGVGDDGQCSIKFGSGDISEVHDYKTMGLTKETRKVPGSARLRLLLPPLSPPDQLTARTSGALNGLAQRVEEHARSRCSESPHTRDSMSRRVDVFLHERKQALIKTEPVEEMYADFEKQHSGEGPRCKLSTYKNYLPWNMKDAYRETCLCAHCESQRLHMEGLRVAAKLLQPVVDTAVQEREAAEEEAAMRRQRRRAAEQADRAAAEAARACLSSKPAEPACGSGAAADEAELIAEDLGEPVAQEEEMEGGEEEHADADAGNGADDDADDDQPDDDDAPLEGDEADLVYTAEELAAVSKLVKFMHLKSKSAAVEAMICGGDLPTAKPDCVKGKCSACGFKKFWSEGCRRLVLDENDCLRSTAVRVWGHRVRWERMRAGIKDREEVAHTPELPCCTLPLL